jgi:hypothetical protein
MRENIERNKPNDYPELQIGYPERNDVRDPDGTSGNSYQSERYHVDLENFKLIRTTADGINQRGNAQA